MSVHFARATCELALPLAATRMRLYARPPAFLRPGLLGHLPPQAITTRHRAFEQVLETLYAGKEGFLSSFALL